MNLREVLSGTADQTELRMMQRYSKLYLSFAVDGFMDLKQRGRGSRLSQPG